VSSKTNDCSSSLRIRVQVSQLHRHSIFKTEHQETLRPEKHFFMLVHGVARQAVEMLSKARSLYCFLIRGLWFLPAVRTCGSVHGEEVVCVRFVALIKSGKGAGMEFFGQWRDERWKSRELTSRYWFLAGSAGEGRRVEKEGYVDRDGTCAQRR